jgi:hypothetical protein
MTSSKFCGKIFGNVGGCASHEKYFCKSNPNKINVPTDLPKTLKCQYCNKLFNKTGWLEKHELTCKNNPNRENNIKQMSQNVDETDFNKYRDDLFCKFCSKKLHNKNALINHERLCPQNPDRVEYDYKARYKNMPEESKQRMLWSKGLTKNDHPGILASAMHQPKEKGPPSDEIRLKISETRRRKIAEGIIIPPTINCQYTVSYIVFKDGTKKMLRSSYELIMALYLNSKQIYFTYETIRAPYIDDNGISRTFLGDFEIGNVIIDTKGRENPEKTKLAIEAFKKIGYELIIVHKDKVKQLKNELSLIMDIDDILTEAKERSDKKDYMIFYLDI